LFFISLASLPKSTIFPYLIPYLFEIPENKKKEAACSGQLPWSAF
jgi:hypothetical protein